MENNISNVLTNNRWFASRFTTNTLKMGNVIVVDDDFGGMLCELVKRVCEQAGVEFNRENAVMFTDRITERYIYDKAYMEMIDNLYISYIFRMYQCIGNISKYKC